MRACRLRLLTRVSVGSLVAAAVATVVSDQVAAQTAASPPVETIANVQFHSDFLMNLHHTLYAAAWARRPETGTARALAGELPSSLDAAMNEDERARWNAAVDYYDKAVAPRDLLFGKGMEALKAALVAGDLSSDAVGDDLRAVLTAVAPVYRRYFWAAHDLANRLWIADTTARMKTVARETTARLETLYGVKWFSTPVRADVVWVGNRQGAYTTIGPPPHATISSGDRAGGSWGAVEIVFHEFSHVSILPIEEALANALGARLREHRTLWHVVQFYLTGAALQQVLQASGIPYSPYLYSTGLFDRAWPQYRQAVEANWAPVRPRHEEPGRGNHRHDSRIECEVEERPAHACREASAMGRLMSGNLSDYFISVEGCLERNG